MKQYSISVQSPTKNKDLVLSLFFDFVGYFSYAIPFFGEFSDVIWAPISALLLAKIYKGSIGKIAGTIEFIEEFLPFTDFLPTFTLTWIYTYIIKKGTV